jgi:signal transduction histidine kinase
MDKLAASSAATRNIASAARRRSGGAHGHGILLRRADHLKHFDDYLIGQDDERLRVSRELHDSTGQLLVALSLSFAHLRETSAGENEAELLDEIGCTISQLNHEIRTLSFLEYPAELGPRSLAAALDTFVRGFARRTGLRVKFHYRGTPRIIERSAAIALLRTAQEALANVHRHAHATCVRLLLLGRGNRLELSISDDGCGIADSLSEACGQGVGLQGTRNRIERLGGRFILRRLKHGTKLIAKLPTRSVQGQTGVDSVWCCDRP